MTISQALTAFKAKLEPMLIKYAEKNELPPQQLMQMYYYIKNSQ